MKRRSWFVLVLFIAILSLLPFVLGAAPRAQAPSPDLSPDFLLSLITSFFMSWQVRVLSALILIDVVLGIAAALKAGVFEWGRLAEFYKTNVVPYLIGYMALYVAIGYIVPPDSLGGIGDPINEAAVILAWATLTLTLLSSIRKNFAYLYQQSPG